jgi:Stigma-specific protein, Stig1
MERLDEFSKLLAASVSRRESLRRIGAFAAGAVLSPWGLGTSWAAGPDRCKAFCRCSNKSQQNQCLDACRACNGNTNRLCGTCGAYACCTTSSSCCNGTCTAVNSDPNNCGACGNVCPGSSPSCNQGVCIANGCAAGLTSCGGFCVNTNADSKNCGTCGNVCSASTPHCDHGICSENAPCPVDQTRCFGVCHDLTNENTFCGTTCQNAVVCPIFTICTAGVCQPL